MRPTNSYEFLMYGSERDTVQEEPRYKGHCVENLGTNVEAWCEETGNGSSTHDLCFYHAEKLDHNPHCFDYVLLPYNGDPVGEDGWGGDVVHPNYDDWAYRCAIPGCGALLGGW